MTVAALILAAAAMLSVIVIALRLRTLRRQPVQGNGHGDFVPWDWPVRPIDGHDHPEPPELEREPAA